MPEREEDFVTIASFQFPVEAHVAKGMLQSEGIEARILDENVIAINCLYSNALGGVKVQGAGPHPERGIAPLRPPGPEKHEVVLLPCPKCHARSVSLEPRRW